MARRVVIIGAGQAGVQAADSIRTLDPDAEIVLIGAETAVPYQRPPLSKDFLGADDTAPLPIRTEEYLDGQRIDWRAGVSAVRIDRERRQVVLSDGSTTPYDALVLATGSVNRRLPVPGAELPGVLELRTLDDAQRVRAALPGARSIAIVGAGVIGLEIAAVARDRGLEVTVLDVADRPMGRLVSPAMSEFIRDLHTGAGTSMRFGTQIGAIESDGERFRVLTDGDDVAADLVLVGIGAAPETALAGVCGLVVNDGIVVDETLRTSDPAVWAIGDCARIDAPGWMRLESVQNAIDHGRHVAAAIVAGSTAPYADVPWFWSVQGATRIQIAGIRAPQASVDVVSGDPASGRFSVYCFDGDRLRAVESVNAPPDHLAARRALGNDVPVSAEQVTTDGFSLKAYVKEQLAARASL